MKKLFIAFLVLYLSSCSAFIANVDSIGKPHKIRMYNGGVLVAEWVSIGKVTSMTESDGWQFMDSETKKLVRVGGDVIIEVIN